MTSKDLIMQSLDKNGMNDIMVHEISDKEDQKNIWQEYVNHHPDSTAYHSICWRNIFEKSFGYRTWYLLAQERRRNRVVGCLPLFFVSSPISARLVSVPFRDRGGLLWDTAEAHDLLLGKAKEILKQIGASFIELKSLRPYPPNLVESFGLKECFYWVHSYADLRGLDMEKFVKKIGAKTRNMIRQANKAALVFEDVTGLDKGVAEWYKLHLVSQKNLGLPPFPLKYFKIMVQELSKTNEIKIFLTRKNNEYLAATIILLHKNIGIYGYSASSKIGQTFRSNDFMVFNTINWLIDNGFEGFDMGSDAPDQKKLLFFKKKWLTKQDVIPIYAYGNVNHWISNSSDKQFVLARKCVRYLPIILLRYFGGITVKYFG